ncbi:MAG TPA: hypothetical protein VLE89_01415 [Chlamydiales bacterium]|nr:hypothetical protein [Chlamydiales bacterium]
MNLRQAVASVLHLFVVFAFFAAGFFFISLPYLPRLKEKVADLFLSESLFCTQLGFGFFVTAFVLLIGFYSLNRGRYLRVSMGKNIAEIDVQILSQTIEECFKTHFPKEISLTEVEIPRGASIEIGVKLASIDEKKKKELLIQIEKKLQTLFIQRFGYSKPFHFIIT